MFNIKQEKLKTTNLEQYPNNSAVYFLILSVLIKPYEGVTDE